MEYLKEWLKKRKASGICRELFPIERLGGGRVRAAGSNGGYAESRGSENQELIDFSSNDYLALSEHPEVIAASRHYLEKIGTGAGAARLMSGDLALYHELEQEVASLKGKAGALIFGSGYLANIGLIPALIGRGDVVFCDRFNHASIYDGCRLSMARLVRFRHNDLAHLEELLIKERGQGRALIVVESIYSMDGDRCPLPELVALKKKYDCLLMVDEAHATGIFGKNGGGVIQEDGVAAEVDIAMGTFGKALGSYGAYVASSEEMVNYLVNRARSFIYSTALPPAVVGASLAALKIVREQPQLRRQLQAKVALFKEILGTGGVADLGPSQIVPVLVGDSGLAMELAAEGRANKVFVTAVRPPTVPQGTARLRFSITLHHSDSDLERTASLVVDLLRRRGLGSGV
ncbi:MAG: 8-amino-7-oxononanoate synthase [Proteobacteria bacterium]|nr:8-amino-7-oxononanoate synthase [Pseudomonadota bacterium]MBU1714913.1 8-amino-7-oxononanoate synthase [Pseudomonadota bacterium]